MVAPSPAPKPLPRRVWPWVLLTVVLLLGTLVGLAWWLVPPWLEGLANETLTTRLGRRLGERVTVGTVEIDLPRVLIHGVAIGDPAAPIVRIDEVEVSLDEDALWSGRAHPIDARVRGGEVSGERQALVELLGKLRRSAGEVPPRSEGRVRMVPEQLHVRGLRLQLWEGPADDPTRRVDGVLRIDAVPTTGAISVAVDELRLHDASMPDVRAATVRSDLVLARTESGRALRFPLSVQVEGIGTQLTPQIAVAGVDGRITVADAGLSRVSVALEGGLSDRDDARAEARLWSIAGWVQRDLERGQLEVTMESFELGKIPEVLARIPVVDSEAATVGGRVALDFGHGQVRAEGQVRLDGLNVAHRMLAREVVRDVGFDLDFAVELDPAKPRLVVHRAELERRGVRLALDGEVLHPAEPSDRRYRLHAEVPATPCDDVLRAIPTALLPSLAGFELHGTFDADVDVNVDFADLDALTLEGSVGLASCRVKERPPRAAAERLAGGFTHRVTMRDGRIRAVHLYPGSSTFTPLAAISPHMVQAVLTTEDGGFWRHQGFLPSQFRTALHRNLEAGKIRLGASTITMQMVKNVLLSHERTLARKLQEMILTWYVETALSKQRIMEIYLNIVELGPGIYGVTRAADHYFGKHPSELTPPEAVYLALMLPSPVRRHVSYCRGAPTDSMMIKVRRILRIMNERKRLPDLDYEIWKEAPIEFDLRERGDSGACLGEITALMEAQHGQRALTGLLASPEDLGFGVGGDPSGRIGVADDEPDYDPSNADAPGAPAMDELLDD
ncbi:MAG: transglycosylase domain-containing protein [Nannocystaceae bacterium]